MKRTRYTVQAKRFGDQFLKIIDTHDNNRIVHQEKGGDLYTVFRMNYMATDLNLDFCIYTEEILDYCDYSTYIPTTFYRNAIMNSESLNDT